MPRPGGRGAGNRWHLASRIRRVCHHRDRAEEEADERRRRDCKPRVYKIPARFYSTSLAPSNTRHTVGLRNCDYRDSTKPMDWKRSVAPGKNDEQHAKR